MSVAVSKSVSSTVVNMVIGVIEVNYWCCCGLCSVHRVIAQVLCADCIHFYLVSCTNNYRFEMFDLCYVTEVRYSSCRDQCELNFYY